LDFRSCKAPCENFAEICKKIAKALQKKITLKQKKLLAHSEELWYSTQVAKKK